MKAVIKKVNYLSVILILVSSFALAQERVRREEPRTPGDRTRDSRDDRNVERDRQGERDRNRDRDRDRDRDRRHDDNDDNDESPSKREKFGEKVRVNFNQVSSAERNLDLREILYREVPNFNNRGAVLTRVVIIVDRPNPRFRNEIDTELRVNGVMIDSGNIGDHQSILNTKFESSRESFGSWKLNIQGQRYGRDGRINREGRQSEFILKGINIWVKNLKAPNIPNPIYQAKCGMDNDRNFFYSADNLGRAERVGVLRGSLDSLIEQCEAARINHRMGSSGLFNVDIVRSFNSPLTGDCLLETGRDRRTGAAEYFNVGKLAGQSQFDLGEQCGQILTQAFGTISYDKFRIGNIRVQSR